MTIAIRRFVIENFCFGQDPGLTDDDSFLEKGIIDSTGVLELVAYLESTHGIKVEDEELIPDNLDSISKVGAYLQSKVGTIPSTASQSGPDPKER